ATYDPNTGALQSSGYIEDGTPHIYRVDIFESTNGPLLPGQSYGVASFDITIPAFSTPSLTRNTLVIGGAPLLTPKPNWAPNKPTMNVLDGRHSARFQTTLLAATTPTWDLQIQTCFPSRRMSTPRTLAIRSTRTPSNRRPIRVKAWASA